MQVQICTSLKKIKASLVLGNISVHETTIRRTENNHGVRVHGRVARRKLVLSQKNIAASLQFAKGHVNKPDGYWKDLDE